jgi:hypothetical protein
VTTPDHTQPEPETWGLVVPFVVCASKGGPYDDDSFTAGFAAGEIDKALTVLAAAGGDRLRTTVRTALVRQIELLAMNRGFPVMTAAEVEATEDYDAMPEWSVIEISRGVS